MNIQNSLLAFSEKGQFILGRVYFILVPQQLCESSLSNMEGKWKELFAISITQWLFPALIYLALFHTREKKLVSSGAKKDHFYSYYNSCLLYLHEH